MDHIGGLPMYVATLGLYGMRPPTIAVPTCIKEDVEKLFELHRKMDQSELKHNLIDLDRLWDVESDNDGQQEGCVLRVYVNVAFSKKTVWKGLPLLNDDESLVYIVCSFIIYVFLVSHLCILIC